MGASRHASRARAKFWLQSPASPPSAGGLHASRCAPPWASKAYAMPLHQNSQPKARLGSRFQTSATATRAHAGAGRAARKSGRWRAAKTCTASSMAAATAAGRRPRRRPADRHPIEARRSMRPRRIRGSLPTPPRGVRVRCGRRIAATAARGLSAAAIGPADQRPWASSGTTTGAATCATATRPGTNRRRSPGPERRGATSGALPPAGGGRRWPAQSARGEDRRPGPRDEPRCGTAAEARASCSKGTSNSKNGKAKAGARAVPTRRALSGRGADSLSRRLAPKAPPAAARRPSRAPSRRRGRGCGRCGLRPSPVSAGRRPPKCRV